MNNKTVYKPTAFFLIAFLISWVFWSIAAYFSYQTGMEKWQVLFMMPGMCGPFVAAMIMIYRAKTPELWREYRDRLLDLKRINLATVPVILLLMPAVVLVSILMSLLFGQSANQFAITLQGSFIAGSVPVLLIVILVPILEEMGWRGYGVDSLRSRFNPFATSLWFGLLWACWHLPMFFVKGYYQNQLLSNWVYTANFFVSVFPLAFINNWLYYRNKRSIFVCALFHVVVDLSAEMIPAEQFTKCIVTVVLILITILIVTADRKLFFAEKAPV